MQRSRKHIFWTSLISPVRMNTVFKYWVYTITYCPKRPDSSLICNPRTKWLVQTQIMKLKSEPISTIYLLRRVAEHGVQIAQKPPLTLCKHGNILQFKLHKLYAQVITSAPSIWNSPSTSQAFLVCVLNCDSHMIRSTKPCLWDVALEAPKIRFRQF
jgi:hypothetical protein